MIKRGLRRILFSLFGTKACSKDSSGRMWRGQYFVTKGRIYKGDMIYYDS